MRWRVCALGAVGVLAVSVGIFALVACGSEPGWTLTPEGQDAVEKMVVKGLQQVVGSWPTAKAGEPQQPAPPPPAPVVPPTLPPDPLGPALPVPPVGPQPPPAGPARLRVVCTWDHPCDVDLHVVEPDGQKCWYRNMRTSSGATLSADDTQRTGPEIYNLGQTRLPGLYRIFVAYFAGQGPVTATVVVYRNCGDPNETSQTFSIPMAQADQGRRLYPVTEVYLER